MTVYPYRVKCNGGYYPAGVEVPDGTPIVKAKEAAPIIAEKAASKKTKVETPEEVKEVEEVEKEQVQLKQTPKKAVTKDDDK